ncbi:MAG: TSUP family transporter [Rhodothermales bacterium]
MLYALLGAVAIGLVLGLLGSGGSILTVPVLVYLAGQPDKVAIAESLAIVGAIAAVGALPYARQKLVDWHSVLYFGVPGIIGTYGGAALAKWVPGPVQLALFAVVMLLAAGLMFRGRKEAPEGEHKRQALWKIAGEGLIVGVLTGLVGVGGGFLIVPALVLLGGLSMRLAVGTSLLIIAAKSAAGFWKYTDVLAEAGQHVDWSLIGIFAAIGIVGSFAGNALSQRVPQAQLKRGFAVFLVLMGVFILAKEGPKALGMRDAQAAAAPAPTELAVTEIVRLSPSETAAYLAATPDAVVVDVRTPGEVAASGRLAGALVLDAMAPDFEARALDALDPAQPVVLYCRSGNRSGQAAERLSALGFTDLANAGGFNALAAEGLPTEPYAP